MLFNAPANSAQPRMYNTGARATPTNHPHPHPHQRESNGKSFPNLPPPPFSTTPSRIDPLIHQEGLCHDPRRSNPWETFALLHIVLLAAQALRFFPL